jgi:hypothetical protein
VFVSYEKGSSELVITCMVCDRLVNKVAVAQMN